MENTNNREEEKNKIINESSDSKSSSYLPPNDLTDENEKDQKGETIFILDNYNVSIRPTTYFSDRFNTLALPQKRNE